MSPEPSRIIDGGGAGDDRLDRIFRQLVRVVRTEHPECLRQSFRVAELHDTILPYRSYHRELGLASNADYELGMLELLSGARGYMVVPDRMRDALTAQLHSPEPDPGAFRPFAAELVGLSPDAVRAVGGANSTETENPGISVGGKRAQSTKRCRYCAGGLPLDRPVTYCPHCGENLAVVRCSACSAELEADWKYCVSCGRPST